MDALRIDWLACFGRARKNREVAIAADLVRGDTDLAINLHQTLHYVGEVAARISIFI
jgi:hypothetical protein